MTAVAETSARMGLDITEISAAVDLEAALEMADERAAAGSGS